MTLRRTIGSGRAPGRLVAIAYDADGDEVDVRPLPTPADSEQAAPVHGELAGAGGCVGIYDGDSGRLVVVLTGDAVIMFGRS